MGLTSSIFKTGSHLIINLFYTTLQYAIIYKIPYIPNFRGCYL